jgi:hypothetical protein
VPAADPVPTRLRRQLRVLPKGTAIVEILRHQKDALQRSEKAKRQRNRLAATIEGYHDNQHTSHQTGLRSSSA